MRLQQGATGEIERPLLPPVAYVPCVIDAETGERRVVLRKTRDGRTALLVYTALDRLVEGAGRAPWALLSLRELEDVHRQSAYDVIYPDFMIPVALRDEVEQ